MRLRQVTIEGYRSIREPLTLVVDPNVTVVLGANDHGKSNLLEALLHLNKENPFLADDLNWDLQHRSEELPRIEATFDLDDVDRDDLAKVENTRRAAAAESEIPAAPSEGSGPSGPTPTEQPPVLGKNLPKSLTRTRNPSGMTFRYAKVVSTESVRTFMGDYIPSFQLFLPTSNLPDSASAENISDEGHEFLRGIFSLAGLDEPWDELFAQNPTTSRRLSKASNRLNDVLRSTWTQGSELTFHLRHNSASSEIELLIEDPAVAFVFGQGAAAPPAPCVIRFRLTYDTRGRLRPDRASECTCAAEARDTANRRLASSIVSTRYGLAGRPPAVETV